MGESTDEKLFEYVQMLRVCARDVRIKESVMFYCLR